MDPESVNSFFPWALWGISWRTQRSPTKITFYKKHYHTKLIAGNFRMLHKKAGKRASAFFKAGVLWPLPPRGHFRCCSCSFAGSAADTAACAWFTLPAHECVSRGTEPPRTEACDVWTDGTAVTDFSGDPQCLFQLRRFCAHDWGRGWLAGAAEAWQTRGGHDFRCSPALFGGQRLVTPPPCAFSQT